jgi:hypothetical protein
MYVFTSGFYLNVAGVLILALPVLFNDTLAHVVHNGFTYLQEVGCLVLIPYSVVSAQPVVERYAGGSW